MIIDLTQPVHAGMQVYPGDPEVTIDAALDRERDGVEVALLSLGSHTGTHLDAPSHSIAAGRTTGDIRLDELCGEALVVHLPNVPARATIELHEVRAVVSDLESAVRPIVIINTGWAGRFGTDEAIEHPVIAPALASWLLDHGMHVLGVDTLSPDATWDAAGGFPVHEIMLGADHLIVENLTNLASLPQHVHVSMLPLPIDVDGAPLRAIATV